VKTENAMELSSFQFLVFTFQVVWSVSFTD